MGLYKLCKHRERTRDRCHHGWWGAFQHQGKLHRVSLSKWANQEIHSKAEAQTVLDRMKEAARTGRLSKRDDQGPEGPLTFAQFAQLYADKHARAKDLALAKTIDYRLKPLIAWFGPRRLTDIKTADIEDFIAELRKPHRVSHRTGRRLKAASINRHLELLRHMLNWAVAREYIDRTPFRRGSETLIRPLLEDNKSCAPGFSWTLDCERVLAGGVSRWGNQIRNRRRRRESPEGDRRRRRARPGGTVVSPAQARDGAASAARRGS